MERAGKRSARQFELGKRTERSEKRRRRFALPPDPVFSTTARWLPPELLLHWFRSSAPRHQFTPCRQNNPLFLDCLTDGRIEQGSQVCAARRT